MSDKLDESKAKPDEEKFGRQLHDFDDALHIIGDWSWFQLGLIGILLMAALNLAYVAYSPILVLYTPSHKCNPNPNLVTMVGQLNVSLAVGNSLISALTTPLDGDGKIDKCHMYSFDMDMKEPHSASEVEQMSAEMSESGSSMGNVSVIPCKFGHHYADIQFSTIAIENNWVCSEAWRGPFSQSIFYAGGIVGTLIFGFAIDLLGRVTVFLLTNAIVFIVGILSPLAAANYTAFLASRFIMGMTHPTFYTSIIILAMEYVSPKRRSLVCNIGLAISLSLGGMIQPWLMILLADWKLFHLAIFGQGILIIFSPLLIQESIRWQVTKGRREDCIQTFTAIAKRNRRSVSEAEMKQFVNLVDCRIADEQAKKDTSVPGKQATLIDLIRYPRLRRNTIIATITWMLISSIFDGHIRNIVNLDYSLKTTFTISAFLELPADLGAIWALDFFGRRWSGCISLSVAAVCTAVSALCLDNAFVSTTMAMISRFFITFAMNTGMQITMELMPTELRGQGTSLANVFGQAAMFFAPFFVHASVMEPRLPFVIFTIGSSLAAMLILILPETADEILPDTVEEAESFGLQYENKDDGAGKNRWCTRGGFFYMPWMQSAVFKKGAVQPMGS